MYTESSASSDNDIFDLASPTFTYTGDVCLQFWAHMRGNSIGELRVYQTHADLKLVKLLRIIKGITIVKDFKKIYIHIYTCTCISMIGLLIM